MQTSFVTGCRGERRKPRYIRYNVREWIDGPVQDLDPMLGDLVQSVIGQRVKRRYVYRNGM